MTLTEMRYIVMLARERHFGRAADFCHVSQPTLSVALKKVEQRYGVMLFERSSADVRATPVGEKVALQAQRVLEEADRLIEMTTLGKDPLIGALRLGAIYTIAPYLLPRLIPAMHQRAPRMPMYLQENFTVNLAAMLRAGQLDVVVVAEPFNEPGIVTAKLYDEAFCLALPADHGLAKRDLISADEVAAENLLLLGSGNCFRDQVVQACPKLSEPGGVEGSLEGSSLETVRHMIASGVGISVVPISAAESWRSTSPLLAFRRFADPEPKRGVLVAWRASFPRPQAIDVLRKAILDCPPPGVDVLA